ncbi:MAG: Cell division protein FtsZ [Candidatus Fermentimicrarchaeum limneticum]|uniref:Cell division protein FtsZ n=1 Tax=Fermentimicrarchaeum limneticum TaxID=2795018 RepID=A0A7D6BBR5_FERL1|nr:MAG: Cell division protein FtsZ [Candidatus Fermentimicrarchaeum limneticum]
MESIIQEALKESTNQVGEDLSIPRIVVMGVGGAGCNTINRLAKVGIRGAELIAVNTDKKHLSIISESAKRVLIGQSITRGLGAGGYPEVALKAVEASKQELETILADTHLLFIAAGMGGGTGTGAAPAIADIAKQQGAIVVAMVTYPFELERARLKKAEAGIESLRRAADTIVVIDNNRLVEFFPNLPIDRAFNVADEITARAVRGITETITTPSLINIDFADVRSIMGGGGVSMIAVGEAKGTDRVKEVVKNTLHHRLLDVDYRGATGVLLHLTGGGDMTLGEANQIGELLTEEVEPTANVIWGARLDGNYEGRIEAIAIFTGIKSPYVVGRPKRGSEWSLGEI